MYILYGRRCSGRVYTAANEPVSTVFFHVFFVPLIPLGTIIVSKRGLLLDEGVVIPFNKTSVWAAYLRHAFFGAMCLAFAMTVDGLFLDSMPEPAKPVYAILGAAFFVIATYCWLWAMFALGSRNKERTFCRSWGSRAAVVFLYLFPLLAIMFGTASFLPKKVTLESIAADRTITDAEAIARLAQKVFPKDASVKISAADKGIELHVSYLSEEHGRAMSVAGQSTAEIARLDKAATVWPTLTRIQMLIQHGRSRHLVMIGVSTTTTLIGKDGRPVQFEVYRVTVPLDKFDALVGQDMMKLLRSPAEIAAELGVVDIDNFSKIEYRK